MILRLWDDLLNEGESGITNKLPQPTLIVAFDLKVTTHNGLSLTTGFNPYFMINPPLHQNEPLLAWYNEHIQEIGQLIQTEAYKSTDILLPPPAAADIVPIRVVSTSMETLKTAWVAATIHLLPVQERLWYTVCDKCKKTVNLPVGWDLPCMYCNKEMNVEPRCNVQVFLNDESGTLSAALFAGTVEKFIQFTAAELMEADENNAPLTDEVARKIENKRCFLKYFDKTFKGKAERTYTIVKLYGQEEGTSAMTQPPSNLTVGETVTTLQSCNSMPAEKEQQMFSPSTKKVIEEIASTVAMDETSMLPAASAKRGIIFGTNSDEKEGMLSSDQSPSSTCDIVVPNLGSESPMKKLKNKPSEN